MKNQIDIKKIVCVYLPLIVILIFILFPFYWTLISSIKPEDELYGMVVTYDNRGT